MPRVAIIKREKSKQKPVGMQEALVGWGKERGGGGEGGVPFSTITVVCFRKENKS